MKIIYTDGACSGNPGPGGWALLLFNERKLMQVAGGYEPATTNNQMELQAAIAGLKLLRDKEPAIIYTDSQYVKNGITLWLPQWKSHNWKTAGKKPVKNRELWETLDALNHSQIQWQYVAAHNDNLFNEICDRLARRLISTQGQIPDLKAEFEKLYWSLKKSSATTKI